MQLLVLVVEDELQVRLGGTHQRITEPRAGNVGRTLRVGGRKVAPQLVLGVGEASVGTQPAPAQGQCVVGAPEPKGLVGHGARNGDLVPHEEGAVDVDRRVETVGAGVPVAVIVTADLAGDQLPALFKDVQVARPDLVSGLDDGNEFCPGQVVEDQSHPFEAGAFDEFSGFERLEEGLRPGDPKGALALGEDFAEAAFLDFDLHNTAAHLLGRQVGAGEGIAGGVVELRHDGAQTAKGRHVRGFPEGIREDGVEFLAADGLVAAKDKGAHDHFCAARSEPFGGGGGDGFEARAFGGWLRGPLHLLKYLADVGRILCERPGCPHGGERCERKRGCGKEVRAG